MQAAGDRRATRRPARSWSTTCGWVSPPMVPRTARSDPSRCWTRAGASVCGGRRPGRYSAGWPAVTENPWARLWRKMPTSGTATADAPIAGVGLDERHRHARPVGRAQVDRVALLGGATEVDAAERIEAGCSRSETIVTDERRPVRAVVEDPRTVVARQSRRLHEDVGPLGVLERHVEIAVRVRSSPRCGRRPARGTPGSPAARSRPGGPTRRCRGAPPSRPGRGRDRPGSRDRRRAATARRRTHRRRTPPGRPR